MKTYEDELADFAKFALLGILAGHGNRANNYIKLGHAKTLMDLCNKSFCIAHFMMRAKSEWMLQKNNKDDSVY